MIYKLWSQLQFRPSLTVLPSNDSQTSTRFVVILTLACLKPANARSSLHQLGEDVPNSDLVPPDGVPQFALEEAVFKMDLSYNQEAHVHHRRKPNKKKRLSSSIAVSSSITSARTSTDILDNDRPSKQTYSSFQDLRSSEERTSDLPNGDHVLELIDAALGLAISDIPARMLPGMVVCETSSFKTLDDFCPAVWNPNYLAVSMCARVSRR